MRKWQRQLERGQGVTEYALLTVLAAITAIAVLAIFQGEGGDFRSGIIYQGIFRPVQCVVQGIDRDNCTEAGTEFNAVRFPTVYNRDGNSRKLCSTIDEEGNSYVGVDRDSADDVFTASDWADACGAGVDRNEEGSDVNDDTAVLRMVFERDDGIGVPEFTTDAPSNTIVEGNYRMIVRRGNVDRPGYAGPVESVRFQLSQSVPERDGGTFNGTRVDNVDARFPSLKDVDEPNVQSSTRNDYTISNERYLVLAPGNYTLTATPFTENDAGGTAGDALTITFEVVPEVANPPAIQQIFIRDTNNLTLANFSDTTGDGNADNANRTFETQEVAIDLAPSTTVDNVNVTLNGPVPQSTVNRTENPYYVFGENSGSPVYTELTPGDYTLAVRPFDADGTPGSQVTVTFTVSAIQNSELEIASFQLWNTDTNEVVQNVNAGDTLELSPSVNYTFWAIPDNSAAVESIEMGLAGPSSVSKRTENVPAYTLLSGGGGQVFLEGSYTLTGTAWSGNNLSGNEGPTKTVNFTITYPAVISGPQITGFFVANLDRSGRPNEFEITNGMQVDKQNVAYNWNVFTETDPPNVSRVEYQITGNLNATHTENHNPYHFRGDTNSLNLDVGSYTLEAEVFDGADSNVFSVNFDVVDTAPICTDRSIDVITLENCNAGSMEFRVKLACHPSEVGNAFGTGDVSGQIREGAVSISENNVWLNNGAGQTIVQFVVDSSDLGGMDVTRVCSAGELDPLDLDINWPNGDTTSWDLNIASQTATPK